MSEENQYLVLCSLFAELQTINWLVPWWCFILEAAAFGQSLERQFRLELGSGHELFDTCQNYRAIAKREDCDDVLFFLPDATKPYALVHLTWGSKFSDSPTWPQFIQFNDLQEFNLRVLLPVYKEFNDYG
ncbi:hypothetical protein [Kiloniella antarctica]|uniref:Uncharacterized protein n=1 Tax=Kiloniella antarctica TaxID=1550907 RepID=A0ABW5BLI6_9PROT